MDIRDKLKLIMEDTSLDKGDVIPSEQIDENALRNTVLGAGAAAALAACAPGPPHGERFYRDDDGHVVTIDYDPQDRTNRVRIGHQDPTIAPHGSVRRGSLEPLFLYRGEVVERLYDYRSGHSMIKYPNGRTTMVSTVDLDPYYEDLPPKTVGADKLATLPEGKYKSLVRKLIS